MELFKISFLFVLFLSFNLSVSAQSVSKKVEKLASKRIEKLNDKLKIAGEEYRLTEEQMEKAHTIFVEGLLKFEDINKQTKSKEERKKMKKPINKEINKRIHKEVLSKEQKKALKIARQKMKKE